MSEEKSAMDRNAPGRKVADAIAMGLISGRSVAELTEELVRQGWKREDAAALVAKIDDVRKQAEVTSKAKPILRRGLLMHVVMGGLWIAAGVMLMVTAKPERDLSSLGVAVISLGVFEMVWAGRNWNKTT